MSIKQNINGLWLCVDKDNKIVKVFMHKVNAMKYIEEKRRIDGSK